MINSLDVKYIYNREYFLKAVDGFNEFQSFDGSLASLFSRYRRNIALLGLTSDHNLLEIGCGRGEVCIFHALQGGRAKGVDFSGDVIALAREKATSLGANVDFVESSFDVLDDHKETYDRILASEFIEHISIKEAELFIKIAHSILKNGGKLLVFTFPNTLQRKYGYPIQRFFGKLFGKSLPKIQEDTTSEHYRLYHLNEQNYFSLKALAIAGGFKKIEIGYDVEKTNSNSIIKKSIVNVVNNSILRHIFLCNLYMVAEK